MKNIPLIVLCICSFHAKGQADSLKAAQDITAIDRKLNEEDKSRGSGIWTKVEVQPEYPGGYEAMFRFIRKNMTYPRAAVKQKIQGVVYVVFVVEPDGSISGVRTLKGISKECDLEAERVVSMMPKWKPGQVNDQNVSVRFVLPIKFRGRPRWNKD